MKKYVVLICLALSVLSSCSSETAPVPETEISYAERVSYVETVSYIEVENAAAIPTEDKLIAVAPICQYPELPTGCESVSAVMVLQFYGEDITPTVFASEWLSCSKDFYTYGGIDYGPDPNSVFAGDPFTKYAYGCFAPPIADAVNNNSEKCSAEVIRGKELDYLCEKYIADGKPLLIWATMGMTESYNGKSWMTPEGELFTWITGEHCLVLVGYNDNFYFLLDPENGNLVGYEKQIVEKRFAELGNQAVYISLNP